MKFVYMALAVALVAGGAYLYISTQKSNDASMKIPEGYHRMEDGSLMKNDAGVTEGMFMREDMDSADTSTEEDTTTDDDNSSQATVTLDPNARVFTVTGVNHLFDTEEIRVKKGDTVTINFESTDGFHDWVVDEFNAATSKVQPGVPTSVTFVADQEGTFEYYCSVGSHRAQGMVGNLIVEG